jgi:PqqD family protein of HPr-rel-A system
LRDVDDGFVVYHRPSGKTHLLNEASYYLLTELLTEPKDLAAIAAAFEPGAGGPAREEYLDSVAEILRRLEQYGLIERV